MGVCVYYCRTYYKAVRGGRRRICPIFSDVSDLIFFKSVVITVVINKETHTVLSTIP